jgi:hypothetical protein
LTRDLTNKHALTDALAAMTGGRPPSEDLFALTVDAAVVEVAQSAHTSHASHTSSHGSHSSHHSSR